MGSKVTPSLISWGGVFKTTPRSSHRIQYAVGSRVKDVFAPHPCVELLF